MEQFDKGTIASMVTEWDIDEFEDFIDVLQQGQLAKLMLAIDLKRKKLAADPVYQETLQPPNPTPPQEHLIFPSVAAANLHERQKWQVLEEMFDVLSLDQLMQLKVREQITSPYRL